MKRIYIALIMVVILSGCAITPVNMAGGAKKRVMLVPEIHKDTRTYDQYYVQIMSIDKQRIQGAGDKIRTPVYVTPGQHTIDVQVLRGSLDGLITAMIRHSAAKKTLKTMNINVKSGRRYLISATAKETKKTMFKRSPQSYTYSIKEYAGTESPVVNVNY